MDFNEAYEDLRRREPRGIAPDLDRITALADLLGDPQRAYPTIHVTGTNGKSSVVRLASTLLAGLGIKAGTYTSPHLQDVRERFTFAGRRISPRAFADLWQDVSGLAGVVDERVGEVTFFEALTAMAYWWFADLPVDAAVVEVGMGGTWDATNLVRGEVAVLTPVDVDHAELGRTPAEIATEKAGIIKPGQRVALARQRDDVRAVIDARAVEVGATVRSVGPDAEVLARRAAVGGQVVDLRVGARVITEIFLPLHGAHQADNAALALLAVDCFAKDTLERVEDDAVRGAFAAVRVPGRLERVHVDPTVVLDGAHNPHGARTAAAAMEEAFGFRNLVVVLACLADKDLPGIAAAYAEVANHVVVAPAPSTRGASADAMAAAAEDAFRGSGVAVETAASVDAAIDKAIGVVGEGDGVLVTGSLYTVGAARDRFLPLDDPDEEPVLDLDSEEDEDEGRAFDAAIEDMIERLDRERGGDDPTS